jgi:hypothetical protein
MIVLSRMRKGFRAGGLAACAAGLLTMSSVMVAAPSTAEAQATCRAKCTDEEKACLKRTSNKSQCGGKANACMKKCK